MLDALKLIALGVAIGYAGIAATLAVFALWPVTYRCLELSRASPGATQTGSPIKRPNMRGKVAHGRDLTAWSRTERRASPLASAD